MKKNVWLSVIFVLLSMQGAYALTAADLKDYNGYDIIDSNGVQKVRIYGGGVPICSLTIDGSLLSEYVMARLLHMNNTGLKVYYLAGTPAHYGFTYFSSNNNTFHYARNMGAIEFYESSVGGVALKVYLDPNRNGLSESTDFLSVKTFELTPSASSYQKLAFDYLVSSLVSYLTNDGGSGDITPVPGGIKFEY